MTTSSPSLRVLCLHDNSSSATKLYLKLHLLDKRLYKNHGIELIYVNSPLRGVEGRPCDDEGNKSSTTTTATDQNRHVWWEEELSNDNTTQYVGLDASLLHLRQIYNTMPFQGILAEGAGAAIASLFLLSSSITPELEFGVFLNGTTLLRDENERLIADWPCLHVVDSCPSDDTDMLIRQFGGQVRHLDGDSVTKDDLNALGKFLVEQKNRLYSSPSATNSDNRLVLQNQLHLVEQQAAQVFAEQAAKNPPKALMAVISPQTQVFGAWSGSKAPKPGGGAPCPPEFLLKRQQRSNKNDGGPSREHPDKLGEEESGQSIAQDSCVHHSKSS